MPSAIKPDLATLSKVAEAVYDGLILWARRTKSCDYLVCYVSGDYFFAVVVVAPSEWAAVEVLRHERGSSVHAVLEVIEMREHSKPLLAATV